MSFRKLFFWLHLSAGLVAGLIIAILCCTGTVLAFEKKIVAWSERDVRRVSPPSAEARPLGLDELLAAFRAARPEARIAHVIVSADPRTAVAIMTTKDASTFYLDPYTAALRPSGPTPVRDFMKLVTEWHRYLARNGDQRPIGKAVTGAANLVFLFLAVSGLYLWWPRQWTARALRPSLWFVRSATGKARDRNWHNVAGFWSLPALIVLTTSGAVIGYTWAGDLVYKLSGETPPRPGAAAPMFAGIIAAPTAETRRLTASEALARVQAAHPTWQTILLREGLPPRRGAPTPQEVGPAGPTGPTAPAPTGPAPYSATVTGANIVTDTVQLILNPFTGEVLQSQGYADQTPGRRARMWLRYLHTGEALGWAGQLIAGLASLSGCLLVYTGFALSWRRFCTMRTKSKIGVRPTGP